MVAMKPSFVTPASKNCKLDSDYHGSNHDSLPLATEGHICDRTWDAGVVLFFIFYLEVERAEPCGMYTVVAQLKLW